MKPVMMAALGAALLWSMSASAAPVERYAVRYDAFSPSLGAATHVLLDPSGGTRMVGQYADGILVARFDSDGNVLWSQELPGLAVAPSGQWAAGQGAAIDPQGRTFVLTTSGHLLVFDANGFPPWDVDLTTFFSTTFQPVAVVIESGEAIYVAGSVTGPSTQQDMLLARLGITMTPMWTRGLDRNLGVDQVAQLRLRPQGGVVMAGTSDGALSLWGYDAAGSRVLDVVGPAMSVGALDVASSGEISVGGSSPGGELSVARYSASGALLWTAGAAPYRIVSAVRAAADGSLYVAGASNTNGTFYIYDLLKFSAGGQLLWERNYAPYGDSFVNALELDRGEPVITGEYGYCYGQIMTMKHSAGGDLLWQQAYQPPQAGCGSVNYGLSLAIDAQRNIHVAGYTLDASTANGAYPYKPTLLKYGQVDLSPPSTAATLSGTPSAFGWYRAPVTVSLTAKEGLDLPSGVKEIRWSLDGGPVTVVPGSFTTVTVSTDGAHALTVQAVDFAGNVEPAQVVAVNVDRVRPTATIRATPNVLRPANGRMVPVVISGSVNDALSGVASAGFTVTDEYGQVQPSLSAFGQTILLQASRRSSDRNGRVYTISVRVTDLAGNATTAVTQVTVP